MRRWISAVRPERPLVSRAVRAWGPPPHPRPVGAGRTSEAGLLRRSRQEKQRDLAHVNGAAVAGTAFVDPEAGRRLLRDRERDVLLEGRKRLPFGRHGCLISDSVARGVEDGDSECSLEGEDTALYPEAAGHLILRVGDVDLIDVVGRWVRVVTTNSGECIGRRRGQWAHCRGGGKRRSCCARRAGRRRRSVVVSAGREHHERWDCQEHEEGLHFVLSFEVMSSTFKNARRGHADTVRPSRQRKRRHRFAGSGVRRSALVVALEKPGAAKTADHTENDRQCDCLSHRVLLAKSRLGYKRIWMRRGWQARRSGRLHMNPRARHGKKRDAPRGAREGMGNRVAAWERWVPRPYGWAPRGRRMVEPGERAMPRPAPRRYALYGATWYMN